MVHDTQLGALVLAVAFVLAAPARASGPDDPRCASPFTGSELSARVAPGTEWSGVATSRARPEVIALWGEREAVISRDDGRTFQKLDARFEHIDDVVVGASGTVFVLDGNRISMAFSRGHQRRVTAPQIDADAENLRLIVGGGYLALVSRAGLALTRDYGATWQIKEFPGVWADEVELTIRRDGSLDAQLTIYNCHSGDYDLLYRSSIAGPWVEIEGDMPWRGAKPGYDPCGRLLELRRNHLVRWSAATGWRQLDVVIP
jgi:hypothetical protein